MDYLYATTLGNDKEKKGKKLITVVIDPIPEASFYSIRFSLASLCHQRGGDGSGNILVINMHYIQFLRMAGA